MNKMMKVVLDILIVIACLAFVFLTIEMVSSYRYAHREKEDPVETERRVFEHELRHKSYGEIIDTYYVKRMYNFEPQDGMEDIYNVAEYAHAAFMSRVYAEKGDDRMSESNALRMETVRNRLGAYAYTADEVDEVIRNAP
jgi:hypothetical protein